MKKNFEKLGFYPADILLPKDADMSKWAVVACDQFTSQPEYWEAVEKNVGDAPSTLRLILPEAKLNDPNVDEHIADINTAMKRYLDQGVFKTLPSSLLYIEREQSDGKIRHGLIGMVDLDQYDFTPGSGALIRATEGTVLSRIPPRVRIREGAQVESPHVMLLCDDRQQELIEPLYAPRGQLPLLYDLELMLRGGHLRGYAVTGDLAECVTAIIEKQQRRSDLYLAVGDGNHSLATAKTCWERIKPGLTPAQRERHPARYALAELVNLHCPALNFEPIHRVLFHVDAGELISAFTAAVPCEAGEDVVFLHDGCRRGLKLSARGDRLPVDVLQEFLDRYLAEHPETGIDYVHGTAALEELSARPGNCGVALQAMDKNSLFPAIIAGGVLPRKTFSMGEAEEKRYYMECRKIV